MQEDVEVVEPEIGHHFLQLPFAQDGAENLSLLQFILRYANTRHAAAHHRKKLAFARIEVIDQHAALRVGDAAAEDHALIDGQTHDCLHTQIFRVAKNLI